MKIYSVSEGQWAEALLQLGGKYSIFAPVGNEKTVDYEEIGENNSAEISYQSNTPVTPLKAFFFPIKENVVQAKKHSPRLVVGVPACDLNALALLDKIFLDEEFLDTYYQENRRNTAIIGKDCYQIKSSCHCTTYGMKPYAEKLCDVSMSVADGSIYLQTFTEKGEELIREMDLADREIQQLPESVQARRKETVEKLNLQNKELPDNQATRIGILKDNDDLWKDHARTCVSCGACSMICPTCHCFLLIDRQGFEKIKNWDTCQHPAFERVAAGEDPLRKLYNRLKNRYLCKFVYKPDIFGEIACTGCGRCIDACIGKIDKNEVIIQACK